MRSTGFRFLFLGALLLILSCKRKVPLPSLDSVLEDGGSVAQPGVHGEPEVSFTIESVYVSQKLLRTSPWHEAGGTWTFFDAKTSEGIHFGFGFAPGKERSGMSFGEVVLTVQARDEGKRLVDLFARQFRVTAPLEKPLQPLMFRPCSAAFFATDAQRTTGGFAGKGGGYFATKLFLQRPSIEAEVFFNFNLKTKEGHFAEKDSDYAKDLIAFLASELRDGKPARLTPSTDPSLIENGPRIVLGRTLPGTVLDMVPARDHVLMKEVIAGVGVRVVSHALENDASTEVFRVPDDIGSTQCVADRCVLENVKHTEEGVYSSKDAQTLLVADRKTREITMLTGPWSNAASLPSGAKISADGKIVLVDDSVPNLGVPGGKALKSVLYIATLGGLTKGPIDFGDTSWMAVSINTSSKRSEILIRKEEGEHKVSFVKVDQATGAITPAAAPLSTGEDVARSPNGKKRVACVKGVIVVTETGSKKEGRFSIPEVDRKTLENKCVRWASDRFLLYVGDDDFTGFLDSETMKLNDSGVRIRGRFEFDNKFEYVVVDGKTVQIGHLENK
jgi:hypothetical protein